MQIILLEDIKSLGKKGDVKEVSDGYARNFLIPKNIAKIATAELVKQVLDNREKERKTAESRAKDLKNLSETLKAKEIVIKSKGKDGKLFGSVSARDIASKIKEQGFLVEEKMIILKSPIKKTGQYAIEIRLSDNISSNMKLSVVEEN